MVWDALSADAAGVDKRDRDRWIGVFIGVLAVLLAICSMGGGNASKDATLKNIEATNGWAFFQAKNMRRHVLRMQVDEFELLTASQPGMPADARAAIDRKVVAYKDEIQRLTTDPKTNEGLDELFKRNKVLEAERDLAMARDPYFDYAEALLQIAIVLASVAIISGGGFLLGGSLLLGALGALLTVNGFTLMLRLPFIG